MRAPRGSGSWITRRTVTIPILIVIAVVPWLVPWGQLFGTSTSAAPIDPMARITTTAAPQSSTSTSSAPAPKPDIDQLAKQIAREAKGFDIPVADTEVAGVSTKPGPVVKLGRMQIPDIGLDTKFSEGVYEKALLEGPGHWPGTPMPGRTGNTVISGHRNTNTQPFLDIDLLKPGQHIVVTVDGQKPTTYAVTKTTIVPQEEYKEFVLRQPADPKARQLTIFACHPEGNPVYRIVVQATAV